MPWLENKPAIASEIPRYGGSYALFLELPADKLINLPRFGTIEFPAGVYIYTGSAKGSGGIRARVTRHINQSNRKFWHLDWFRPHTNVIGVFYQLGFGQDECVWSSSLSDKPNSRIIVAGFGSSDCRLGCPAHLIWFERGFGVSRFLSYIA